MARSFLLFFLLFNLGFALDSPSLVRADKWLRSSNIKQVLRAYHEYKNLRIDAVMRADKRLQIKALKGIVAAGKRLRLNVETYKRELARMGGAHYTKKIQVSQAKRTKKNQLLNAVWHNGNIVLSFKRNILSDDVHYFVLDTRFNKNYRYIFDIKAEMKKRLRLSKQFLKALRINYNGTHTRLVLENKKPLKVSYRRSGNRLTVFIGKKRAHVNQVTVTDTNYLQQSSKVRKKVIVIDPGHGGKDTGAIGYRNYREKIIVFQIARRLKKALEAYGHKVYITRSKDVFIPLRKRTSFANKKNADLFISIHANSVPRKGNYKKHHGFETYFLSRARSKRAKNVAAKENSKYIGEMNYFAKESFLNFLNSKRILASNKLAIDIQRGMLSSTKPYYKVKDGGVRKGPFWVLVGAQMPAVLVEVGFVTSPMEARYLVNKRYQNRLAQGIALGVQNYFKNN